MRAFRFIRGGGNYLFSAFYYIRCFCHLEKLKMQLQTYILYPEIAKFSTRTKKNQHRIFKFFTFVPILCIKLLNSRIMIELEDNRLQALIHRDKLHYTIV